jgi:hypothetical protein
VRRELRGQLGDPLDGEVQHQRRAGGRVGGELLTGRHRGGPGAGPGEDDGLPHPRHGQLALERRRGRGERRDAGHDLVGHPGRVEPAHLLGHGAPDRRVAGVQPGHVEAGLVRGDQLGGDLVEVEVGGVDQARARRRGVEQLAWHERPGVQAHRRRRDQPRRPQRDQVRRARPRPDEVDRHATPPAVPAGIAGLTALQIVTGMAGRQPV